MEVRAILHKLYPYKKPQIDSNIDDPTPKTNVGLQMLHTIHKDASPTSDIDRYLDTPVVDQDGKDDPKWVLQQQRANTL